MLQWLRLPRLPLTLLLALSSLAATGAVHASTPSGWTLPNGDRASTRAVDTSPITATTAASLRVVWRFRFTQSHVSDPSRAPEAIRGVVATPVVAGRTVFVQDSTSSVYAIGLGTGRLRWKHRFRAPNYGRNGLSVSSGSVYGSTDTTVFALSAATGRLLWQRRLVTPQEQYVDIAPLIANNLVYVATVGYPPDGRGALYALDAHSGAVRWRLTTIRGAWRHPLITGGGGAWYSPSLDGEGNLYWGTANPYPSGGTRAWPNGTAYGGPALYTDSLLVLDAANGRLRWYDQVTPHDIRDHDFQLPPVLASLTADGEDRDVVIGAGKAGLVIAWDRKTHRRLWKAQVGRHLNDTGPLPARTVTICPGFYGGVESPLAYSAGRLFVPVVDLCARGSSHGYESIARLDPVTGTGEFLALDAATGKVLWRKSLPQADFGCATSADGVVFTSTFNGHLYGFDESTGATLWQAMAGAGINGCPALAGSRLIVAAGSGSSRRLHPPFELIAYGLG